jgi:fructose/tagatose bisphosphate aldolase
MIEAHPIDLRARQLASAPADQRLSRSFSLQADLRSMGVYPASIRSLYQALGRGELDPMTVPAFNVRGLTYELARAIWRTALDMQAGPFMFELAPPEASSGGQTFEEYAALTLAAAAREGYRGPVFLQGDHFEVESPQELTGILGLAHRVLRAGFYQLDIDASHLFDPQSGDLPGFHLPNARATARIVADLRGSQPPGVRLTLGGEVGEIGGRNTTFADVVAFHQDFLRYLPAEVPGLDKISAQTGTRHGGMVEPDGRVGRMPLDFELVSDLSRRARAVGLAGLVQHGASTLSLPDLARLPAIGVLEVHLATQIQNIVFDHPAFPRALLNQMRERLLPARRGAEGEPEADEQQLTEAQRFYRARWECWGLFRTDLLQLPHAVLRPITQGLSDWVAEVFTALRVRGRAPRVGVYAGEAT